MITRVLRPALTFATATAVVLAALVVLAYLNTGSTRANSQFVPAYSVDMCNSLVNFSADGTLNGNVNCVANGDEKLLAGENADITTELDMPTGLNFANITTFGPANGVINSLAAGTKVGGLNSTVGLGIGNNTCAAVTDVEFNLFSIALPGNSGGPLTGTVRQADNIAWPQQEGASNRFERWKVGNGDFTTPQFATLGDGIVANGATPYAVSTAIPIQNYPIHMLNLLDPDFVPGVGDGLDQPLIPDAMYGGVTKVAGSWVPLYFAQMAPGGLITLPAPFDSFVAGMGAPSLSVLNDPTSVKAFPSTITDFCTDVNVITMLLGDPAGAGTRWENPPQGTGYFIQYASSLRDLDQDGFENTLDPCPDINEAPGTLSNPKFFGGNDPLDSDGDGLPNQAGCDTVFTPLIDPFFVDQDKDGFSNRGDNCPFDANGDPFSTNPNVTPGPIPGQVETELGIDPADGGPRTDAIGDACDSEKGTITVHGQNSLEADSPATDISITMSDTVANGRWMSKTNVVTKCFSTTLTSIPGGADNDGDGYCNLAGQDKTTDGSTVDPDPCLSDSPVSCEVRHDSWGVTSPPRLTDTDGDNYSDAQETYYGTDPVKSCSSTAPDKDEILDNWPLDQNDDQSATGSDVLKFGAAFGQAVNAGPFAGGIIGVRLDLNVDGLVTGQDILQMGAGFGKTCSVAGIPAFSQQ